MNQFSTSDIEAIGCLDDRTLEEIAKVIVDLGAECVMCHKPLKVCQRQAYTHDGGWNVKGLREKQWIYFECWCGYQNSLKTIKYQLKIKKINETYEVLTGV